MRKSILLLVMVTLVLIAITGCGSGSQQSNNNATQTDTSQSEASQSSQQPPSKIKGESITLKFGHQYDEKHPLHLGAELFAQLVNERSDGNITVELFPNGIIGGARDLIEGLQLGTVDITLAPTTNVAPFYNPIDIFYIPFIFRDAEHAYQVSDGPIGQELYEDLRNETGIHTLAMFESGFRTITTKDDQIITPDDLKGIKMRVPNSPINIDTFEALGANPTPMAIGELFTALQQGTVDGQDNPIGNVYAYGYHEVQNYITLSGHQWAGIMLLMGENKWNELSPEYQQIIADAAIEAQDWQRVEMNEVEEEYLKLMEEAGMTVTRLNAQQKAQFQEKLKEVWNKYADVIGQDLIDKVVNTK